MAVARLPPAALRRRRLSSTTTRTSSCARPAVLSARSGCGVAPVGLLFATPVPRHARPAACFENGAMTTVLPLHLPVPGRAAARRRPGRRRRCTPCRPPPATSWCRMHCDRARTCSFAGTPRRRMRCCPRSSCCGGGADAGAGVHERRVGRVDAARAARRRARLGRQRLCARAAARAGATDARALRARARAARRAGRPEAALRGAQARRPRQGHADARVVSSPRTRRSAACARHRCTASGASARSRSR